MYESEKLPTVANTISSQKLPGLDGFRMIAVMAVLIAHSGVGTVFTARHGVAGFFVLSGFLITILLLREYSNSETISIRDFYMRRSLRIFPAYYSFVLVTITWELFRESDTIDGFIIPSIFYVTNYYNAFEGHLSSPLAHLWSLAIEEQFYLLWPVIFLSLMRYGRNVVILFLVCIILVVMVWRSYSFSVLGFDISYVYNAFDTRVDNLAIGCAMAFLVDKKFFLKFAQKISDRFWMPFVTLGLLYGSRQIPSSDYAYGPAFTIDALLLSVLLLQFMRLSQGWFWGWLNSPLVVYLGIISYPTYLWHVWGLQAGKKLGFLPEPMQLLAGVLLSFLLAVLSYHVIEKRFLMLKGRFQSRQKIDVSTTKEYVLAPKAEKF
jgi:peptidoglycan/LPS O-acetylase OafA/YrhL